MEMRKIAYTTAKIMAAAGAIYVAQDYIRGEPVEGKTIEDMGKYILQDVSRIFRAGHVAALGLVGLLAASKLRSLNFVKAKNREQTDIRKEIVSE